MILKYERIANHLTVTFFVHDPCPAHILIQKKAESLIYKTSKKLHFQDDAMKNDTHRK